MIDITQDIINNTFPIEGIHRLEVITDDDLTIIGCITITDDRYYQTLEDNSPDGIPILKSGTVNWDLDVELLDRDGENIDFEVNDNDIRTHLT